MFEVGQQYTLPQSVSSLSSNLDVMVEDADQSSDGEHSCDYHRLSFITASKTQVNILHSYCTGTTSTSQVITGNKMNKYIVLQTKWCCLEKQVVLVVASYNGLLIFDGEGQLLMFWHNFNDAHTSDEEEIPFCRGIACVNKQYVCIGTSMGKVLIITPQKNSFELSQTLENHTEPVSALSGLGEKPSHSQVNFVSADDSGTICMYKSGKKFTYFGHLGVKSNNLPCTSIYLLPNGLITAGYMHGHIRVFDAETSAMLADISAHVRSVSCLDATSPLQDNSFLVISGSEDSFIRVWKVSRDDTITVSQEWHTYVEDLQICGLRLCDASGKSFVVSGYDSTRIHHFKSTQR